MITVDGGDGVVTLDGSQVATSAELLAERSPDWKIARLTAQLEVHRDNWKLTHPGQRFAGDLILLADQAADFKVLKKVLYSAALAGYGELQLAVRRRRPRQLR